MSENALTPGSAVWNYIKNSVPAQLGAAGHLAQSVAQPFTNLFGNGGAEFWNGPQDPQAAHDMSNALMTMYAGSATPGAAEMNPAALSAGMKVYRGSPVHETWPPVESTVTPGTGKNDTFWASTDPNVSGTYAHRSGDFSGGGAPNIMPAEADFKNPLVVDALNQDWAHIPIGHRVNQAAFDRLPTYKETVSSDYLAHLARESGHDGLVLKNVRDSTGSGWPNQPYDEPATTIAALQPGTVKSPLTGETLFSGGSPLNALLGYRNQDDHR